MIDNKEVRNIKKEYRAYTDDEGNKYIEGYASVFNQRSKLLFENGKTFYEVINAGAFDSVLQRDDLDVVLTYQHNTDIPLSRLNKEKGVINLELSVDDKGLFFRAKLAKTSDALNAFALVESGDIFECSFIFTVGEDEFTEEGEDVVRYISTIDNLYDVSVVVNGAYSNTDVAVAERKYKESIKVDEEVEAISEIEADKDLVTYLRLKK